MMARIGRSPRRARRHLRRLAAATCCAACSSSASCAPRCLASASAPRRSPSSTNPLQSRRGYPPRRLPEHLEQPRTLARAAAPHPARAADARRAPRRAAGGPAPRSRRHARSGAGHRRRARLLHRVRLGVAHRRRAAVRQRAALALPHRRRALRSSCRASPATRRAACSTASSTRRAARSRSSSRTCRGSCTAPTCASGRSAFISARIKELAPVDQHGFPPVLMGDFNAEPDSDEIRYLRGYHSRLGRSVYFADCFAAAGDGSPGLHLRARQPLRAARARAQPPPRLHLRARARSRSYVGSRSPPGAASPRPRAASIPRIIMGFSPRSRPPRASYEPSVIDPGGRLPTALLDARFSTGNPCAGSG